MFRGKIENDVGARPLGAESDGPSDASPELPGMASAGWVLGEEGSQIKLYVIHGDAANFTELRAVLQPMTDQYRVGTAIVLGTQASGALAPHSQDTRVLSILLMLRMLTKQWGTPLHIITENQEDQTALLAITPNVSSEQKELGNTLAIYAQVHRHESMRGGATPRREAKGHDFINTQAIYARALAMALAYPQMFKSVGELFLEAEREPLGGVTVPQIDIIDADSFGLVNGTDVSFATLQHIISAHPSMESGVMLGLFLEEEGLVMLPPLSRKVRFVKGDRLVVCARQMRADEPQTAAAGATVVEELLPPGSE